MTGEPTSIGDHLAEAKARQARKQAPPAPALNTPDRDEARVAAQRHLVLERWRQCVPPQLSRADLSDLAGEVGGDTIAGWAGGEAWGDGVCLFIIGATGVGKSHAAIAACRPAITAGEPCEFWPLVDLMAALHWESPGHRELMARLQRVTLLVLDDLGSEDPNDWTRRKLYELVNYRWNHDLAVIVTSNLEPDALEDAVGPRTYSRLVDGAVAVRLVGPDRRRHAP